MQIRVPDFIAVYGENGQAEATVSTLLDNDILSVYAESEIPLCKAELVWNTEPRQEQVKVLGDAWERGYGALEWKTIDPNRLLPWYFFVSNGSDSDLDYTYRKTECFGVKTQPAAFCGWTYSGTQVKLIADIRNGANGVQLNGRRLHIADIVFAEFNGISAFQSGKQFCKMLCDNPLTVGTPVYGFNDWYYAYGQNSAENLLKDGETLSKLSTDNAVKPYMVIDDGWSPNACNGPWHTGNHKFPDMAKLAADFEAKNLIPGIWIRPLRQEGECAFVQDSWRMPHDAQMLDPSNPAVLAYIDEQISRLVDWGYKMIKYDFVTYDIFNQWGKDTEGFLDNPNLIFSDKTKTTAEIIIGLYQTIRKAAKHAALIGCNAVSHLCAGLVELNRTGDDTSGREWARTRKMGINTLAFRLMQDGVFYMADADCVGLTAKIPWHLNEQWLRILSASATPLFISWDQTFYNEQVEQAVKQALERASIAKEELIPLDWMETITPAKWMLNGEMIEFDWNEA